MEYWRWRRRCLSMRRASHRVACWSTRGNYSTPDRHRPQHIRLCTVMAYVMFSRLSIVLWWIYRKIASEGSRSRGKFLNGKLWGPCRWLNDWFMCGTSTSRHNLLPSLMSVECWLRQWNESRAALSEVIMMNIRQLLLSRKASCIIHRAFRFRWWKRPSYCRRDLHMYEYPVNIQAGYSVNMDILCTLSDHVH